MKNVTKKLLVLLVVLAAILSFGCEKKDNNSNAVNDPQGSSGSAVLENKPGCYVTIVKGDGDIPVAYEFVAFDDHDGNGSISIDDVLKSAHESFGFKEGYSSSDTTWGKAITMLWGNSSGDFGYYCDDVMAFSLDDVVPEDSHVVAFVYRDAVGYADRYTYFDKIENTGNGLSIHLSILDFGENWNPAGSNCGEASIYMNGVFVGTTDENGYLSITTNGEQDYLLLAEGKDMVPALYKNYRGYNHEWDKKYYEASLDKSFVGSSSNTGSNTGVSKGPWHSSNVKDDGTGQGPYPCYGKNNTCSGKTINYQDLYCDACDANGDNIEDKYQ